jgi:hypothetical protein
MRFSPQENSSPAPTAKQEQDTADIVVHPARNSSWLRMSAAFYMAGLVLARISEGALI